METIQEKDCSSSEGVVEGYDSDTQPHVVGLPLKTGWLKKRGERRKSWKKRWFVLREATLSYYKDEKEYEVLCIIDIKKANAVTLIQEKPNAFSIVTGKRIYYFKAHTQEDTQEWVTSLQTIHNTAMNQVRMGSGRELGGEEESEDEFDKNMLKAAFASLYHDGRVLIRGYLYKQRQKHKQKWRKLWFVLCADQICVYKDEKEYELHRLISLRDVIGIEDVEVVKGRENCFVIKTREREFVLQAESEQIQKEWTAKVKEEIKRID